MQTATPQPPADDEDDEFQSFDWEFADHDATPTADR